MGHLPSACLSTGSRIRRQGGARLPAAADLVGGCGEYLPQPTTHRPAPGLLWPKAVTQLIGQLMNMPENLQLLRFHVVHLGCPCSHRSQPYLSIISSFQSYLHNILGMSFLPSPLPRTSRVSLCIFNAHLGQIPLTSSCLSFPIYQRNSLRAVVRRKKLTPVKHILHVESEGRG